MNSPALPQISVVVPTYRRPDLLRRCVGALLAQSLGPAGFEVIVVDDGHDDATRAAFDAMAREAHDYCLRYLRPARGRGPAVARNCGWLGARSHLIAFTDDDTIPAHDWLATGLRAMSDSSCVALAGRVVVPPATGNPDDPPTDHERMTQGLASAVFVTANAFVRRAALERVGGFDERFRRAWREDSDLQFRLQRDVGDVGRCDDAVVVHPVRRERWGASLRQQKNVFYDALLYREHPQRYRAELRPRPPWNYHLIVLFTAGAGALAFAGRPAAALGSLSAALVLVGLFARKRLNGTARTPSHVAEMLATSALIPFLSVYWRLRGAWHFRVWFP